MDRVNELTKECFAAAIQLRRLGHDNLPSPEQLHHRLRAVIDDMYKRAAPLGFSHQDSKDMAYAIVALIDEMALSKPDQIRGYWLGNLLQLHYFNENIAGDGFFNRLASIRAEPHRQDVLRVYYLCLLFGFQGRYRLGHGEVELMNLADSLQQELARSYRGDIETFAPHGVPQTEALTRIKNKGPLLAFALGSIAFAVLCYGGMRLALYSTVQQAASDIAALKQK
jgi:type VI secretion system protein ImpK